MIDELLQVVYKHETITQNFNLHCSYTLYFYTLIILSKALSPISKLQPLVSIIIMMYTVIGID